MLDYARKLTLRPQEMTEQDAAALRHQGFDDRAIHDICAVTAYFNFVNRMADGLGVDLEEDERFPVEGIPAGL
ncbi:carboxymuconolactone decarboxylase family protein [Candidatus Neomarinimicrobiota bacterium]